MCIKKICIHMLNPSLKSFGFCSLPPLRHKLLCCPSEWVSVKTESQLYSANFDSMFPDHWNLPRNTEIFKVVHSPDAMQSSIHYLNMLGECESSSSLTIAASFRMLAHQSCSWNWQIVNFLLLHWPSPSQRQIAENKSRCMELKEKFDTLSQIWTLMELNKKQL